MLARHGGEPADLAWGLRELERRAGRLNAPVLRLVPLHEHLASSDLRIIDHLDDVVDRRRGHAARRQNADDFRPGSLARPLLDNGRDLVPAVATRRRGREARIARELAATDDLA